MGEVTRIGEVLPARPYSLSFEIDYVCMIGGVTHQGGKPGLSDRVTLSAAVKFCHACKRFRVG